MRQGRYFPTWRVFQSGGVQHIRKRVSSGEVSPRERSRRSDVPSEPVVRESRRSTRVRLKVLIEVQSVSEPLTCEGETIVVNLDGALVMTAVALRVGMNVSIRVHITDKGAAAEVVYVDPDQPRYCGIKLAKPENIWGVSLLPDDWREGEIA